VAGEIKRSLGIPFVITLHEPGRARRKHQGNVSPFPDQRLEIEDRLVAEADHIIAECSQDKEDLIRLYDADPSRTTIIPCELDPIKLWPWERIAKATGALL